MKTHERRLKRAIVQARVQATERFTAPASAPDTEPDAYCRPDYCPPTLRSGVTPVTTSALTGKAILIDWEVT